MTVIRHCSEAEARQIDAQRLAQEVIGCDPLVPFDLAGVAAEVVSLRKQLQGAVGALERIAALGRTNGPAAPLLVQAGDIAEAALRATGGQSGALSSPSSNVTKEDQ